MSSIKAEIKVKPNQFFGNLDKNEIYWLLLTAKNADAVGNTEEESSSMVLSRGSTDRTEINKFDWNIARENYLGPALYNEAVQLTAEILEIEGSISIIEASQIPEGMYFESNTGALYKKEKDRVVYQQRERRPFLYRRTP